MLDLAEKPASPVLAGQGMALLFEKPSARTRNSMEMAVVQLGGHPVTIRGDEVSLDVRESVEDVTRTLACYHAAIGARVFEHEKLERMVEGRRRSDREPPVRRRPPDAGAGRRAHHPPARGSRWPAARSPTWATATTWPLPGVGRRHVGLEVVVISPAGLPLADETSTGARRRREPRSG